MSRKNLSADLKEGRNVPLVEVPGDVLRELVRLEEENERLKEIVFRSKSLTL